MEGCRVCRHTWCTEEDMAWHRAGHPPAVSNDLVILPVGTRIRFLKQLGCGPTGDHPSFIYAEKGDMGEVTGHGCVEGHWVSWDKWPHSFGATLGVDFEEAKRQG